VLPEENALGVKAKISGMGTRFFSPGFSGVSGLNSGGTPGRKGFLPPARTSGGHNARGSGPSAQRELAGEIGHGEGDYVAGVGVHGALEPPRNGFVNEGVDLAGVLSSPSRTLTLDGLGHDDVGR